MNRNAARELNHGEATREAGVASLEQLQLHSFSSFHVKKAGSLPPLLSINPDR
jgi:hypothetical protein